MRSDVDVKLAVFVELKMPLAHAEVLRSLLQVVGGPSEGPRYVIDDIDLALIDAGVECSNTSSERKAWGTITMVTMD